mmetsp:Transcript_11367/g.28990  ORF Transcript_11367/g.28990 Transcript_11367/m.28990 type:complete len:181 (+) Transcript_11367:77-619(+)
MSLKEEKIAWQSSLASDGVLGIVDPITIPPGGPGELPENRPGNPQHIGHRTGAPVAKAVAAPLEEPLAYPEPRAARTFERKVVLDATAVSQDYGGDQTQRLVAPAHAAGLNTGSSFLTPAFNGTSVTKSSFPAPRSGPTASLNLADPQRSHKPHGAAYNGTVGMRTVEQPTGAAVSYLSR